MNWNKDIIWKMRAELELVWTDLEDDIPESFKGFATSVTGGVEALKRVIAG